MKSSQLSEKLKQTYSQDEAEGACTLVLLSNLAQWSIKAVL